MLSVIYAELRIHALCAVCHYAECLYADCLSVVAAYFENWH
jgi:hypothetical protein